MISSPTHIAPVARPLTPRPIRLWREHREGLLAAGLILGSLLVTLAYQWVNCPHELAPDEAHYWDWSRRLDWSYYSKGPLVAWAIRGSCELFGPLSVRLTGDLAAAVRLPAALLHAVTLVGWYILAAGVFRLPKMGLAVVALAVALPVVRVGAVLTTIDPPFLACWCWALVCVWKAVSDRGRGWWIGAAGCCAFGVLAKYTMVLFPPAVVGYLLVYRRGEFRRAGIWLLFAGLALGLVPIAIWNAQNNWVSFRHVLGQAGGGNSARFQLLGPAHFLAGQFGMLFGLWLAAFFAAAWRYRPTREGDPGKCLLWWCAVPVWCFFALASFVKTGQANWPAPAYIAGFILAVAWVVEQLQGPRRRLFAWCLSVNVAIGLAVAVGIHYPGPFRPVLARIAGQPTERDPAPIRKIDITARLVGSRTLSAEVDRLRARVASETGREPILAGTHWTIPGHLGLYCSGQPRVYAVGIANRTDRHSQYDCWRPNPIADAQAFHGRTFLIVGSIGHHMLAAFDRVEAPIRVLHMKDGIPMDVWTVWVCHGFRGFPELVMNDAGY